MLKEISIKNIPGIHTKKIIKQKELIHYDTVNRIYARSKVHARKMIQDAENVTCDIQNRAWVEGYMSGMAFAIQDLAKFVNDSESHRQHIISGSLEVVTSKLKAFFDHDVTLCQLLGALVNQIDNEVQDTSRITITVPEKLHATSHKIKHLFVDTGLTAEIKKSPQPSIVVEYGKEIWTFDIHQVADSLARAAIQNALASDDLEKKCTASSLEALQNIRDTLSIYLKDAQEPPQMMIPSVD